MSLEHIKSELGLPKSYDKLCNLKDRVMKPSLDEITANTDIDLTYENVKKGVLWLVLSSLSKRNQSQN